jgi:CRP-like cAMP-binding protein
MPAGRGQSLSAIKLLSGFDEDACAQLEKRCSWRTFPAGATIIEEEGELTEVYFVVRGRAEVVKFSQDGREVHYGDVTVGGHFGELAALDGLPRSANVVAVTETEVASVSLKTFLELVLSNSDVALQVMRRLTEIVRSADNRILDLSTLGAHNRVQAEILRLAREAASGSNEAAIAPTQGEIANRVSVVRETVARVIRDLDRHGIITRERRRLVVRDIDRLAAMVKEFHHE